MDYTTQITEAKEKFGQVLSEQLNRVEKMKKIFLISAHLIK